MSTAGALTDVHLLELPVPLAAKARQQFEELMREFALIQTAASTDETDDRDVPRRLMDLVDVLTQQFSGVGDDAEARLDEAIDRSVPVLPDHVLRLPPEAAPASKALGEMIEEADEYCRRGQHLLTLAAPEDCVAYRRWYLGEVIDQLAGRPPTPWPQYPHRPA